MWRVAFVYAVVVMLLCLWLMRRIMGSPFGLACVGIHENRLRMAALGSSVTAHLQRIYVVAGFFAGVAGALSAQINQIVGLDTLGFDLSAEALVMLVLGGAGRARGVVVDAQCRHAVGPLWQYPRGELIWRERAQDLSRWY